MNELVDGPVSVHVGDALSVLREMASESVHCCITSPPYWSLRDYGATGQLGLEASPDEYVARLVEVFREVRRVLRRDGTCWLNLGDSYASNGVSGLNEGFNDRHGAFGHGGGITPANAGRSRAGKTVPPGLKPKDLVGIPWRVAFALQADGWWLRSEITWCKRAPMPESVTDRPTSATEKIFLLTKAERYYYDTESVREPLAEKTLTHRGGGKAGGNGQSQDALGKVASGNWGSWDRPRVANPNGANLRNYWLLGPEPFAEAHFAVFPSEIPLRAIKAGTSEHGVCSQCGSPWERVVEREAGLAIAHTRHKLTAGMDSKTSTLSLSSGSRGWRENGSRAISLGWQPTCPHSRTPGPATVLDPFAGSGTTLSVARRLGRRAVGIELQADYLPLIRKRIAAGALPLLELLQVEEVTR